jgi:hypothetical protein
LCDSIVRGINNLPAGELGILASLMPTIKEVAELAGVSIGTVSHVISGALPVSDVLRRKIVKAVRALDYQIAILTGPRRVGMRRND